MRIVFIGTGAIAVPTVGRLLESAEHQLVGVVTQPDRPVGREQRIQAPAVKDAVSATSVPVLQPERVKRPEAVAQIQAFEPDVIAVMAYGQILPPAILQIPRFACLNLHASLLPRHRGAAPVQAAIREGDLLTGITVMYMDEGLDTGDILLQSKLKIRADETGGSLHDRLAEIAPVALFDALALLAAGTAPRISQNAAEATYAPKLERAHGEIDWSDAPEKNERKIRAYNPWPGAFMVLRDAAGGERKLKIFSATTTSEERGSIGDVVLIDGHVRVRCGRGGLQLGDVQLEGKQRTTAEEFVRGHPWIVSKTE